jgi:hypothetical protein
MSGGVGSAPVAPALARAAAARDAERLAAHPDAATCGWRVEYDGGVVVTVALRARAAGYAPARVDEYVVTLVCDSYDAWPPEVRFVDAETRAFAVGRDLHALPRTSGLPGFQIHPAFNHFQDSGRVDQLVCFSFTRGYYDSAHQPQPHERWTNGRHWLYTTVRVLHRALQPPYYQGRMG